MSVTVIPTGAIEHPGFFWFTTLMIQKSNFTSGIKYPFIRYRPKIHYIR